ncbi:MAG: hypothetical protein ACTSYB_10580 [Candidatus Helarchaeota archaeon]
MGEKTEENTGNETISGTINKEDLFMQLEKWQAALRLNKKLQANYRDEITKYRNLRDQLKEEIKILREEALKEKQIRDSINNEVAKLKNDRSAANAQIAELKKKRNTAWEEVKKIRNSLREIINRQKDSKRKLKKVYPLMKRLEELDWTIMTKTMPFEKEQEIMNQIDQIVNEIAIHQREFDYNTITLDFEEAKKQIDELKELAQQYHELMLQTVADGEKIHARILELVKESEKHHQNMLDLFAKIEPLKEQEEEAHQNMVKNIKELELLEKGKQEIYKELRAIEKKFAYLKHLETLKKLEEQEKILDQKAQEAFAKYQSGKKLTMTEFSLLLKKGLIKNE